MSGAVRPSWSAKRIALDGMRPVAIATSVPRSIAARTAARVRSPISKSSPMIVPSRSSTTRRIGKTARTGPSAMGTVPLDAGDPRLPGEVPFDRGAPAGEMLRQERAHGVPLVGADLEERDAVSVQRIWQAIDEAGDAREAVG